MVTSAAVTARLRHPFAALRFGSGGRCMPADFSISSPEIGFQKRSPSGPLKLIGARMKASRLALCRHIEMGPRCVIAIKAHASTRSRSKRHVSMKLWMTNDSLLTRPRVAQRSALACHAFQISQPTALNERYGLVRIPFTKVAMTLDRPRRSELNSGVVGSVVGHEDHSIAIAARVSDAQRVEGDRRSCAFLDLLLNRLYSDCCVSASQCAAAGFRLKLKGCQTHDVAIANEESYDRRCLFEIA